MQHQKTAALHFLPNKREIFKILHRNMNKNYCIE